MAALDRYDLLAEELDYMVNGSDSSANEAAWKRQDLRLLVEQMHNQLIRQDYNLNAGQEGIHNVGGQFLVEFNDVAVSTDNARREKYAVLPSNFVNLPSGKGIAEVYAYNSSKHKAEPITPLPTATGLLRGLWATSLQGQLGYKLEGNRIYFSEEGKEMTFPKVSFKMVIGNSLSVGADQEIIILQQSLQFAGAKKPEDMVNDNSPAK